MEAELHERLTAHERWVLDERTHLSHFVSFLESHAWALRTSDIGDSVFVAGVLIGYFSTLPMFRATVPEMQARVSSTDSESVFVSRCVALARELKVHLYTRQPLADEAKVAAFFA